MDAEKESAGHSQTEPPRTDRLIAENSFLPFALPREAQAPFRRPLWLPLERETPESPWENSVWLFVRPLRVLEFAVSSCPDSWLLPPSKESCSTRPVR